MLIFAFLLTAVTVWYLLRVARIGRACAVETDVEKVRRFSEYRESLGLEAERRKERAAYLGG